MKLSNTISEEDISCYPGLQSSPFLQSLKGKNFGSVCVPRDTEKHLFLQARWAVQLPQNQHLRLKMCWFARFIFTLTTSQTRTIGLGQKLSYSPGCWQDSSHLLICFSGLHEDASAFWPWTFPDGGLCYFGLRHDPIRNNTQCKPCANYFKAMPVTSSKPDHLS